MFEMSKFCFGEVVDRAIERFESRREENLVIYAGMAWRELWNFVVFEDISKIDVFEGDRSGSSSGCGCGFGRNIVNRGEIGIELNRSGESFLVASDISNCEKKEFIPLRINSLDRKDLRETTLWMEIRRIRRIRRIW